MAEPDSLWPALPLDAWQDTYTTLHLWTQVVGKIRMALSPPLNHWWHATLYVNARGLTTSAIPFQGGTFEIQFDFLDHVLEIRTWDGGGILSQVDGRTARLGNRGHDPDRAPGAGSEDSLRGRLRT